MKFAMMLLLFFAALPAFSSGFIPYTYECVFTKTEKVSSEDGQQWNTNVWSEKGTGTELSVSETETIFSETSADGKRIEQMRVVLTKHEDGSQTSSVEGETITKTDGASTIEKYTSEKTIRFVNGVKVVTSYKSNGKETPYYWEKFTTVLTDGTEIVTSIHTKPEVAGASRYFHTCTYKY